MWYRLRVSIYIFIFQFVSASEEMSARVRLHVDGSGFHRLEIRKSKHHSSILFLHSYFIYRNFRYHIKLNNFTTNDCYISLHFVLPSALYVNINELTDVRRADKVISIMPFIFSFIIYIL